MANVEWCSVTLRGYGTDKKAGDALFNYRGEDVTLNKVCMVLCKLE